MKRFRKVIFWLHLTAGVIAGLVILVMSVTGVLLALGPQIIQLAERGMQTVEPPQGNAPRLGPQALFARAREARPDLKPSGLTLQADPTAAATFTMGREGVLYLNPYTGEVTGEGAKGTRAFFRVIEDWHRWLGASGGGRPLGRAITGACNAAFLLLAVSGIYLWWPKKWAWRNLKPVILFKRGLKARARNFNWHNVAGFWSSLILIVLTATGMVMSYQWANNLLYTLTGSPVPAQQGPPPQGAPPAEGRRPAETPIAVTSNLDQLWSRAEQQSAGWKAITLRLPQPPGGPVAFSIREDGKANPLATSQVTIDPATTEVVKWEPYDNLSAGRRLRSWMRVLHTGEAGRVPGQIIAGLASLGGGLLVWTGLSLSWRRFRAWRARRLKGTPDALPAAALEALENGGYRDEALQPEPMETSSLVAASNTGNS